MIKIEINNQSKTGKIEYTIDKKKVSNLLTSYTGSKAKY